MDVKDEEMAKKLSMFYRMLCNHGIYRGLSSLRTEEEKKRFTDKFFERYKPYEYIV